MVAGRSDIGDRGGQEDAFVALERPDAILAGVFDGMGGSGTSGRPAADLAVETVTRAFQKGGDAVRIVDAIVAANVELRTRADRAQRKEPGSDWRALGMGTTATAAFFQRGHAHLAHVGDGRIVRMRRAASGPPALEVLTVEHTVGNDYRNAGYGEEELAHLITHTRNIIVRALGMRMELLVDQRTVATAPGDVFLLSTHGGYDGVTDLDIAKILAEGAAHGGEAAIARAIIEHALAATPQKSAHHDNTTVVVHIVSDKGI